VVKHEDNSLDIITKSDLIYALTESVDGTKEG